MDRAEFIAIASPPCHECGEPVQRVETSWKPGPDWDYVPRSFVMICANDHRVEVEHFDA